MLVDMHCRGDVSESVAHGLVSRRPGERGRRHAPPRADRRRARAARRHRLHHRPRHDRPHRRRHRRGPRHHPAALPHPDAGRASSRPRARPPCTASSSRSTRRRAARPTSGACACPRDPRTAEPVADKVLDGTCRRADGRGPRLRGARRGVAPTLAVVLVGDDPASQVYVREQEARRRQRSASRRATHVYPRGAQPQSALLALLRLG